MPFASDTNVQFYNKAAAPDLLTSLQVALWRKANDVLRDDPLVPPNPTAADLALARKVVFEAGFTEGIAVQAMRLLVMDQGVYDATAGQLDAKVAWMVENVIWKHIATYLSL